MQLHVSEHPRCGSVGVLLCLLSLVATFFVVLMLAYASFSGGLGNDQPLLYALIAGLLAGVLSLILVGLSHSRDYRSLVLPMAGLSLFPQLILFGLWSVNQSWPLESGVLPLHRAVMAQDQQALLRELSHRPAAVLQARTSAQRTPLSIALYNRNSGQLGLLLQHGASADSIAWHECDAQGCQFSGPLILHAIQSNQPQMVSLLLEHGASLYLPGYPGAAVLHQALQYRQQLLDRSPAAQQPLKENLAVIYLLMDAGHPVFTQRQCSSTGMIAQRYPRLVQQKQVMHLICARG